jgi:hypothetical protein
MLPCEVFQIGLRLSCSESLNATSIIYTIYIIYNVYCNIRVNTNSSTIPVFLAYGSSLALISSP